jgi:F-type H+-transporting ATPase subunit b
MIIDATFWVTVSFFIFIGILVYFKLPQKIKKVLDDNILNIKNQINEAEKLKEDSKNILTEHEKKISNSKIEVDVMLNKANEEAEKNVIKTNEEFHNLMENKKKNTEERIKQLKNQAIKDIKNASVKIAIESVEKLIKNSLDKSKLDKIYASSIEETKLALKKKSS